MGVQWLRLHTSTAGLIPGGGTNLLYATWCNQKWGSGQGEKMSQEAIHRIVVVADAKHEGYFMYMEMIR